MEQLLCKPIKPSFKSRKRSAMIAARTAAGIAERTAVRELLQEVWEHGY
jgi:hypothetical protein